MASTRMNLIKNIIRMSVALLLISPALADEKSVSQAEAPETGITVSGRMVLPKQAPEGVDLAQIALSQLTGALELRLPPGADNTIDQAMGKPENFKNLSAEEQRAWIKRFASDPKNLQRMQAAGALRAQAENTKPLPIKFGADGEFRVDGVKPGLWKLNVRISHPSEKEHFVATSEHVFDVKEGSENIALGELVLKVSNVLLPGNPAPDFTGVTPEGKEFKLSDHRGKYVLLDFWATWCAPCVAGMPELISLHKEYGGEKFEIIGLSLDNSVDDLNNFLKKKPVPYQQVYVGERSKSRANAVFGVQAIPSIWLIDPDGKIVARDLRGEAIGQAVKKFLQR